MGFLSNLLPLAGSVVGNIVAPGIGGAIGGALGSALGGSSGGAQQSGTATSTTKQEIDPRIASILFGSNGNNGVLNQFAGYLNTPQSAASQIIGGQSGEYLKNVGPADLDAIRQASLGLIKVNEAPYISNPLWTSSAQIKAPNQNTLDLKNAYQNVIYGDAGANPYLTNALQSGIDLSRANFNAAQNDATRNLQENILPSIRSGAIAAGGYGGSRQGIAEGRALSDFGRAQQQALTQFGLGNTAAVTGAQSDAFNQGQNRSLSALQNLSGQQYDTARAQAALDQQAALANQNVNTDYIKSNQQAQLQTNAQNNASKLAGAGQLGDLLSRAYGYSNANDNYGINRAQQTAGLLSPFLNVNGSTTSSQPLYSNPSGNILGSALTGAGLSGLFGGGSSSGKSSLGNIFDLFGSGSGGTLGGSL